MDFLTLLFLSLMFVGIYVTTMFILLTIQNSDRMFKYPTPNESYSITVIIPAYNEGKSIASTIKHVVNSNYPNIKILVVNDGSTDNTSAIVKKLCKKYKNLKFSKDVLSFELNKGAYATVLISHLTKSQ